MIRGSFLRTRRHTLQLCALFVIVSAITSCNDAPTDLGADLVPGTDSLYSATSLDAALIDSSYTAQVRLPGIRTEGASFLFGRTGSSEARLLAEFINYPVFDSVSGFKVLGAYLLFTPEYYAFGDTSNRQVHVGCYELKRLWSGTVTWDSVWNADGTSTYYDVTQQPLFTYSTSVEAGNPVVAIPLNPDMVKSWIVRGTDTTLRKELFGLALVPSAESSVRAFRNLTLRIVTNVPPKRTIPVTPSVVRKATVKRDTTVNTGARKASVDNDSIRTRPARTITDIPAIIAGFGNSPLPQSGELIVQGGHIHQTRFDLDLSSIPSQAVILSATMYVTADSTASIHGNVKLDEQLQLTYQPTGSVRTYTRLVGRDDVTKTFRFDKLAFMIQEMMKNGGKGTLQIGPNVDDQFFRMNRLRLYPMSADSTVRPKLNIIYALPGMSR
ncbi:MAG: hypothetical protein FGM24_06295 [Candidatus Kapabacteria bacterium]|nr:hypothetical protein [Candidatus Kapabacteria bacterium]